VHPFGGARSTARALSGGGGGRGAAGGGGGEGGGGAGERRRACRGEILTRTQINAPSDIKTHLG